MKGAILFMAVGALAVLSILALGAASSVTQELKLAKVVVDNNTGFYDALSVVDLMRVLWSRTPPASLYDLRNRVVSLGEETAEVGFVDENSKINIDKASVDVLRRLPGLTGQEPLVTTINAATILAKEDLLLLEGMTPEIYTQLKGLVTVFGSGRVNINTAGPDTLAALGMDSDLIAKIQAFRRGHDDREGTEDDNVFSNTAEIVPVLGPYGLTPPQRVLLEALIAANQLQTPCDFVTLNIVLTKAGKPQRSYNVVLSAFGGKMLSWQE